MERTLDLDVMARQLLQKLGILHQFSIKRSDTYAAGGDMPIGRLIDVKFGGFFKTQIDGGYAQDAYFLAIQRLGVRQQLLDGYFLSTKFDYAWPTRLRRRTRSKHDQKADRGASIHGPQPGSGR